MKNCEDCIKNNRHPNAVGCLQCSVNKAWYDKLKEKKESKGNLKMKNKSKPKFPANIWGINFEEEEYGVLVTKETEEDVIEIARKIKEKYNFDSEPDITYLGYDKNEKTKRKHRRNGSRK